MPRRACARRGCTPSSRTSPAISRRRICRSRRWRSATTARRATSSGLFEAEATTFTDYVLEQRLARAYRLLTDRHGGEKITAVAYDVGFADLSYFYRAFRRRFGATPSDIRAQAKNPN